VNFSLKQVRARWTDSEFDPESIVSKLDELGYAARPFDPSDAGFGVDDRESRELLRALAVAGFAAGNIMFLSISVWAGAEGATRDFFHWVSALLALPAIAYAGRPFFRSAWNALSRARMNMDVPISLAVLTAAMMSLYQVANHQQHAYFDAAVSLLFFLLIGRYLDHRMRARARSAVSQLMTLAATGATVLDEEGRKRFLPMDALQDGMRVLVAAGERIPVDGIVEEGETDVDARVYAGAMNLTGPIVVRLTAHGEDTFLSEIIRLMATAEESKSAYVRLADRLAGYYAPVVHVLAGATLFGWLWWTNFDWPVSLLHAIAVLIITCPCALGLAVPAVQVVASGVLFRNGVMIKDGSALERMADIDTVIFDKTGTLTMGEPKLSESGPVSIEAMAVAAGLAAGSAHPLSRAIVKAVEERGIEPLDWCGVRDEKALSSDMPQLALAVEGRQPVVFSFTDTLRPDAAETIRRLKAAGLRVEMISGDREGPVRAVAEELGLDGWKAAWSPQQKLAYVEGLAEAGRKVGAVDGLRHRANGGRHGLRRGLFARRMAGSRSLRAGAASYDAEFRLGHHLQCLRRARRHGGLGLAPVRGGGHVRLVDHRGGQFAAAGIDGQKSRQGFRADHLRRRNGTTQGREEGGMSVLLYLIPIALFLGLLGLGAFIWSLRSGQYEDLDGEALRILDDDDDKPIVD